MGRTRRGSKIEYPRFESGKKARKAQKLKEKRKNDPARTDFIPERGCVTTASEEGNTNIPEFREGEADRLRFSMLGGQTLE